MPFEALVFGCDATLLALQPARLRDVPPSPDGNLIADYLGAVEDPGELAMRLDGTPGVVGHGLFAPDLVSEVIVGRAGEVERWVV